MLRYKAGFKFVASGVHAQVLDFPAAITWAPDLEQARRALATALVDAAEDPNTMDKWAVLRTALDTHAPQVVLSTAAAVYGIVGLLAGSFLAELLVSAVGAMFASRRRNGDAAPFARWPARPGPS